ncbi:MAG: hypothetical protein HQM12_08890 [SAR324 cluster bacterium]|nr:hypothetical protein [SAR324 cluster bacterium]
MKFKTGKFLIVLLAAFLLTPTNYVLADYDDDDDDHPPKEMVYIMGAMMVTMTVGVIYFLISGSPRHTNMDESLKAPTVSPEIQTLPSSPKAESSYSIDKMNLVVFNYSF